MNSLVMNAAKQCRSCGVELPENSSRMQCERCEFLGALLLPQGSAPAISVTTQTVEAPLPETGTDFGDYVLLNEIARGGMGSVYRAKQKSLNRIVALKRPLPGVAADPERVRRFRTEAEAVAGLSHPNIIPVFESGEHEGEQYFSMAYVEGEPLGELLRRQVVSTMKAAEYVRKIAGAIHHAHQRGVLHRDLKPANIIIDQTDEPRVADFGIACLLQGNEGETSGAVAGTANYMAPEQVRPGTKTLSVATDVYALGGILYHLLTGRPPFGGETKEQILWSAYYEEPILPRDLNPRVALDLEAICLKALQKLPEARYDSAQAMAEDLARFEQGRPVMARPVAVLVRFWMWIRRNPLVFLLLLSLAVAVASVIAVQMVSIKKVRSARADSEGFIGFMNQDLAHDLRDVGRLDLMEKINSRAEDYYTNHEALGDAGYLERKAFFFENAATVKKDLGELAQAEAHAVEAEKIYETQHGLAPNEARWKRHQSRTRLLRQEIARKAGLRPVASEHGEAAVTYATLAVGTEASDLTNRAHLASVLLEQAGFYIGQNQTVAPAVSIARAEAVLREVTQAANADPEWFLWLANAAYYRGRISELRNDHESALGEFTDYLDAVQKLAARFPRNHRWQFELAVAHSQVAAALTGLKQFDAAQPYLDAFEKLSKNLIQLDPRNKTWLSLHAKSLAWQGVVAQTTKATRADALHYLDSALLIQNNLVHQNPDWDQWSENAAETTKALVQLHVREGRFQMAQELAADWMRQCEQRALADPNHVGHQLRWGAAIVSDVRESGREAGAPGQIERLRIALEKFTDLPPTKPGVLAKARVLAYMSDSLDKIGLTTNAAAMLQGALDLRLGFFQTSPLVAKLRDQIPDNFYWVAKYHLKSRDVESALSVAEQGIDWAAKNLFVEENRRDYAKLCLLFTEVNSENTTWLERTRKLVQRCLVERLKEPPALSVEEESLAESLRDWLTQHP